MCLRNEATCTVTNGALYMPAIAQQKTSSTTVMSLGVRTTAFVATAGSGVAILVSLVVIGNLFMEVNDMYKEALADMDEFKVLSN
uniref:Col_cuticle_N domain-containing protein n=1 Tax=Steinernema glaseri TaxID=37863 RepID=A0A1I8ASA9_9BILA